MVGGDQLGRLDVPRPGPGWTYNTCLPVQRRARVVAADIAGWGGEACRSAAGVTDSWLAGGREGAAVKVLPGVLHGTVVFEPTVHADEHGSLIRIFDAEVATGAGLDPRSFVEDSQSRCSRGTVRGLHLRTDGGEGKLVRCAAGAVVDVAVDLRPSSPTYRLWMTLVLDDVAHRSVWLPAGLAHGYQALTDVADVCCRVNRVYRPEYQVTIQCDDPDLAIPWPLPVVGLSERDRTAPPLAVVEPMLSDWFGVLR